MSMWKGLLQGQQRQGGDDASVDKERLCRLDYSTCSIEHTTSYEPKCQLQKVDQ